MNVTAYPLCWPIGWERTPAHRRANAGSKFGRISFERARRTLSHELEMLRSSQVIISTNQELRRDGMPYANARLAVDPGVAVYFKRTDQKPLVLAQDLYLEIEANLRSLALAVEHLRGLERHGGDKLTQMAFSGFAALTGPSHAKTCWEILGMEIPHFPSPEQAKAAVNAAYRERSMMVHPDKGGTDEQMSELNSARLEAFRLMNL